MHLSEDEIRTKVIYSWLKDILPAESQISIEYSFNINIGKGIKRVNSRADVVVRSESKQPLFIVEVKKPGHVLKTADKNQAISYARMLSDGIAPFTVLTNGKESLLFDSITGEELGTETIPKNHRSVKNGFLPSGDAIKARMEALDYLISLSSENLQIFCKGQVKWNMQMLKSDDIFSCRKYIPSLCIERKQPLKELRQKVLNEDSVHDLLLVLGPPQHGKTCFMCSTVELFLEEGELCLFYPAISLQKGLMDQIKEDFEWNFNESQEVHQIVKRLNDLSIRIGKKIFVFVDGWNEMAENAISLNDECRRLANLNVRIILSTTNPSLPNLLKDRADNLRYIATATNLNEAHIKRLVSKSLESTSGFGAVQIGNFTDEERTQAMELYSVAFDVKMSNNPILTNPFYLRLSAEHFAKASVPINIVGSELLRKSLVRKAARGGIGEMDLIKHLNCLGKPFYLGGRPIEIFNLPSELGSEELLQPWIESAILIQFNEYDIPRVDFYYTHDLDYTIAIIYQKWPEFFQKASQTDIIEKFKDINANDSAKSALSWFLSSPEFADILKKIFEEIDFDGSFSSDALRLISSAIVYQVSVNEKLSFDWLEPYLSKILEIEVGDNVHKDQFAELIYSFLKNLSGGRNHYSYKFWIRLLVKYDDFDELGIDESYIGQLYEEDLRSYDGTYMGSSLDVEIFKELTFDADIEVASKSAHILSYAAPDDFLEDFSFFKREMERKGLDYKKTLLTAIEELCSAFHDHYYGSMCKGWLLEAEPDEEFNEEYANKEKLFVPIIKAYASTYIAETLTGFLNSLKELTVNDEREATSTSDDPNQLGLDFK